MTWTDGPWSRSPVAVAVAVADSQGPGPAVTTWQSVRVRGRRELVVKRKTVEFIKRCGLRVEGSRQMSSKFAIHVL
jgi:hypothetical protein